MPHQPRATRGTAENTEDVWFKEETRGERKSCLKIHIYMRSSDICDRELIKSKTFTPFSI